MERCEGCGYAWEIVGRDEIGPRATAAAAGIAARLRHEPESARRRPAAATWSALEYAAHLRDVFLTLRDRLVIGLVEDDPTFKPLYRDERVDLGLYAAETTGGTAAELEAAAAMFTRVFEAIGDDQLGRPVQFGYPPTTRSLLWLGQQVVHEAEHHRGDIERGLLDLDG
jgi:DinB superfamily